MATYFISDLHLSDHEPHLFLLFKHFIEKIIQPKDELYILGDLFEFWIGDDQCSPCVEQVKELLAGLKVRHINWYFLAGNRDFLIGKKFLQATQGQLLPEKYVLTLEQHKILLLHGDTLCTLDSKYQAWRKKVHQRWVQKIFLLLPLKYRLSLAAKMREKSMQQSDYLNNAMMDVVDVDVLQDFKSFNVNVMIHGHVHRPAIHTYRENHKKYCRYVLADWGHKGNYLKFGGGQFTLSYFSL